MTSFNIQKNFNSLYYNFRFIDNKERIKKHIDNSLISNYNIYMNNFKNTRLLSIMSSKLKLSYNYIRKQIKELGLDDLDISHGDILYQLYKKEPLTMKYLSQNIGKDKSTITALIKKMEKLDLVKRIASEEDGRSTSVKLTQKAHSYKDSFMKISDDIFKILYKNFSEDEKRELIRLLSKLAEE